MKTPWRRDEPVTLPQIKARARVGRALPSTRLGWGVGGLPQLMVISYLVFSVLLRQPRRRQHRYLLRLAIVGARRRPRQTGAVGVVPILFLARHRRRIL